MPEGIKLQLEKPEVMNERCFENRMVRNGRNYKNEVRLLPNRGCATLCTFPGDSCMQHNLLGLTVKNNNFYLLHHFIICMVT